MIVAVCIVSGFVDFYFSERIQHMLFSKSKSKKYIFLFKARRDAIEKVQAIGTLECLWNISESSIHSSIIIP